MRPRPFIRIGITLSAQPPLTPHIYAQAVLGDIPFTPSRITEAEVRTTPTHLLVNCGNIRGNPHSQTYRFSQHFTRTSCFSIPIHSDCLFMKPTLFVLRCSYFTLYPTHRTYLSRFYPLILLYIHPYIICILPLNNHLCCTGLYLEKETPIIQFIAAIGCSDRLSNS